MKCSKHNRRGISTVFGVAILVGVVVVLAALIGVTLTGVIETQQENEFTTAAVDIQHDEGFGMITDSITVNLQQELDADRVIVRGETANACSGEKEIDGAGEIASFDYCASGDRIVVLAESGSTTVMIDEYTIDE